MLFGTLSVESIATDLPPAVLVELERCFGRTGRVAGPSEVGPVARAVVEDDPGSKDWVVADACELAPGLSMDTLRR